MEEGSLCLIGAAYPGNGTPTLKTPLKTFLYSFCRLLTLFSKLSLKKIFQEHCQSVKQLRYSLGPYGLQMLSADDKSPGQHGMS